MSEIANGLKVDSVNNAFVVGSTRSADFPTTPGAFDTYHNGGFDAFVTKLNATGSALVFSTFLGGADFDDGAGLAVDAAGNAYVTGATFSPEFPTTSGAFDTIFAGMNGEGLVTKLNVAGSGLIYSTLRRGGGGSAIAVDSAGNA